jgi:hypothetical protein
MVAQSFRRVGATAAKSATLDKSAPAASTSSPAGADQYDVFVSGPSAEELNTRLAGKGLSTEPSGTGVVLKPSLPLRDAVALSKDLATDGYKVQVRRTGGASAQRPKAAARPAGAPAGRRPLRKPVRHPRYSSEERSLLNRPIPLLHTPPPAPDHRPHAPRDTRVDLSSGTFPGVGWTVAWRFLAGAAALFLLLSAGVGSVVRQRRRQRIAELDRALEEAPVEEHVSV